MRSIKYLLLMIGLVLTVAGCGKKEERVPSAAESMKKNKKVIIITDAVNAPFEFGSGTGVQGLDVDLGNEIGKTLNIEVKWVKISGYEHLFEILKKGEAEILISAIAIDPKKTGEFAFSKPYYDTGDAIALQAGKFEITGLAGLSGKNVGVATGRSGDSFMSTQKTATGVTIKKFSTIDDALGALNRTELDAVVGDEILIAYSSVKSFQNTIFLPKLVNSYPYAAVVRKGETDLLNKINETIDRLKASGEMAKLEQQWIGDIRQQAVNLFKGGKEEEERRKAPKAINVNITKVSGAWNMDRLDGFVLVLEGASGRYESTPILTEGNKGHCKFTKPVPPGEYRLNISILKMTAKVPVPELAKTSLTMDLSIARDTTILFR